MIRLLRFALFAMLLAASPIVLAHPNDPPSSAEMEALRQEVLAARQAIKAAVAAKDVVALQKLLTPEFTHTHGSGKVDGRDARIVSLLAGEPVIELAPFSELSIRIHGRVTAIVAARSPILNRAENRDYDFRWIQVYVKDGDTWRLAASQATRLPPPS
ncbi:nuclear transport factor 2 family protein [Ferrovibrio sp.]|uniref:nuclear transport factor 2 family protein n=1 Tax=Ferrovibrio sp. TaxID=1917215 RepID=UPI003D29F9EF